MLNFLSVDIPKPGIPDVDAGDTVDGVNSVGEWFTSLGPDAWKLIVAGVGAAVIIWLVRRSQFLKGGIVFAVLLGLAYIAFMR